MDQGCRLCIEPRKIYDRGLYDSFWLAKSKADGLWMSGRQKTWMRRGKCSGHHRGLRPGHVSTGVAWELGRAKGLHAQVTVGEFRTQNSWRMRREPHAPHASLKRNTKVDGDAGYQVRTVKSERTWDGLVAVLTEHSTDGLISRVGKAGNRCPRDPL